MNEEIIKIYLYAKRLALYDDLDQIRNELHNAINNSAVVCVSEYEQLEWYNWKGQGSIAVLFKDNNVTMYIKGVDNKWIAYEVDAQKLVDEGFEYEYEDPDFVPVLTTRVEGFTDTFEFIQGNDGMYANTNQYEQSSYCMSKLFFNNSSDEIQHVKIKFYQSSENGYDYGLVSFIDTELSKTAEEDFGNVQQNFQGMDGEQIIDYYIEPGEHYLTIKYRKDGGGEAGSDIFKFEVLQDNKVRVTKHLITREEVDERLPDTSILIKSKGNVPTIEALPSMGQASGTVGSYPLVDNDDLTKLRDDLVKQTSSKYMLFIDLGVESWTGGSTDNAYLKLETAYPEVIETLALNTSKSGIIKVTATSQKPVTVTMHRIVYSKVIANTNTSGYYMYGSSIELTSTYYIWTQLAVQGIYGNLTTPIKYANYSARAYSVNQSNGSIVSPSSNSYGDSLQLGFREDGYIYNNGMTMLTFDEDYNAHWVLADPQEEPNVLYTVGETNEAFVSDDTKWRHLSSGMYKLYKIAIGKPSTSGGSSDISGIGTSVINAIMDAAKYGKTPVIYSSNYSGLFFPLFSIEDVKTKTYFDFCGPTFTQYSSSNTGQIGMPYIRFNVSNISGDLTYNPNSVGAGQLMLLNSSYFLSTSNTKSYTPTADYHPATKIYVDNLIAEVDAKIGVTEAVLDDILNEPELVQDDLEVPDVG